MRLLLFADGWVGLNILRFLLDEYRTDVKTVVVTSENELHAAAVDAGVNVLVFQTQERLMSDLNSEFDLGILAWWPRLIREPLLNLPLKGFINTHPSLLPHNRGKHYNFWALVEESPFGVTLHKVDAGIDTGQIVAQSPIPYNWTDTGGTLYQKAMAAMLELFISSYPVLRDGHFPSHEQSPEVGSYHHSSELDAASQIDLNKLYSARELLNRLRGRTFEGHPACWFVDQDLKYEVTIKIRKI